MNMLRRAGGLVGAMWMLSSCALTGNTGPLRITCNSGAESFTLELPLGSGRVYPEGIKTGPDHPCGEIDTGPVAQGSDRSIGLWGMVRSVLGF